MASNWESWKGIEPVDGVEGCSVIAAGGIAKVVKEPTGDETAASTGEFGERPIMGETQTGHAHDITEGDQSVEVVKSDLL
jgi:hypothetical protein